jgi:hypothetical protein
MRCHANAAQSAGRRAGARMTSGRCAQPAVTPMHRGRLPACFCRQPPLLDGFIDRAATSRHGTIAVGTAVAGGPPHRSQRACLAHWALPLSSGVEAHAWPGMEDARAR